MYVNNGTAKVHTSVEIEVCVQESTSQIWNQPFYCTVILWYHGRDDSLWVHISATINILPVSDNISNTIQTPEGGLVPTTVFRSSCLVGVDCVWLNSGVHTIRCVIPEWVRDTYRYFYKPSYCSCQRDLIWLFCTFHHIPSDTSPNHIGHQVCFLYHILSR